MRRGEIRLVDLDPAKGAEADKRRPAVLISNDRANVTAERLGRGVVTVLPLTSNVARVFPFQVLLEPASSGLDKVSKVQPEQVRSVAIERLGRPVGSVPHELMSDIEQALALHLGL